MNIFPSHLTADEKETLFNMPIYVTLLIAGADNKIDNAEISEAIELARLNKTFSRQELTDYYNIASEDFPEKLKSVMEDLPQSNEARTKYLIGELTKLNDILPRLDRRFAIDFYESAKALAKKIAKSSGGILGYWTIGYEESQLIGLDMIDDPSDY
jgi:hypothetical protein